MCTNLSTGKRSEEVDVAEVILPNNAQRDIVATKHTSMSRFTADLQLIDSTAVHFKGIKSDLVQTRHGNPLRCE